MFGFFKKRLIDSPVDNLNPTASRTLLAQELRNLMPKSDFSVSGHKKAESIWPSIKVALREAAAMNFDEYPFHTGETIGSTYKVVPTIKEEERETFLKTLHNFCLEEGLTLSVKHFKKSDPFNIHLTISWAAAKTTSKEPS